MTSSERSSKEAQIIFFLIFDFGKVPKEFLSANQKGAQRFFSGNLIFVRFSKEVLETCKITSLKSIICKILADLLKIDFCLHAVRILKPFHSFLKKWAR